MSKSSSDYGFISLLYSIGDRPLALWSKHVSTDGRVRRVEDDALNGDRVIEIRGPDGSPARTCISCPASPEDFLDIRLPVLVVVLKNLKARVRIAFQLIDEENIRRKFVLSTCDTAKSTGVEPEAARLPLKLDDGWNLLEIDLRSLCRTTCRTEYRALQRLIIYPNCRVRRVYLQDRHYEQNETPVELCQAFFDMYMLKWGIHFVEKSCQTATEENGTTDAQAEDLPPVFEGKKAKSLSKEKLRVSKGVRRTAGRGLTKRKKSSGTDDRKKIAKAETRTTGKSGGEVNAASSPRKVDDNSSTLRLIDSRHFSEKGPIVVSSLGNTFPERNWPSTRLSTDSSSTAVAVIPSVVEVEATEATRNVESTRSKLLTTDEAVGRFLELRHAINRKMLENFRARGLTMTEVELSIYNSKNRRNSYGQGKLIEKHRARVDKACDAFSVDEAIENEKNS